MWVKRFAGLEIFRTKQFHACDNNEIARKTETVIGHASIHVNENKHAKKSSKQHSHKRITKKQKKC